MGSLDTLTKHALKIISEESSREIPSEAHCPQLARKTLPQLGSPTIKVEELNSKSSDNMASLKVAAREERERREAAGVGDRVQNRQPIPPPNFDSSLVGKHLEVRYRIEVIDEDTREPTGEVSFVWWACEVLRVSDGSARKVGATGKELKGCHPAGHVLLRWEANAKLDEPEETESWMGLLPSKWNSDQIYAWRRDPDYGMWADPAGEAEAGESS